MGGKAFGERDPDSAHAHPHLGAEFEQAHPERAALGAGQVGSLQTQAAQGAQEGVGEAAEVEPDLVGPQELGAGAVGEQIELLLLDAVLDLPAIMPP